MILFEVSNNNLRCWLLLLLRVPPSLNYSRREQLSAGIAPASPLFLLPLVFAPLAPCESRPRISKPFVVARSKNKKRNEKDKECVNWSAHEVRLVWVMLLRVHFFQQATRWNNFLGLSFIFIHIGNCVSCIHDFLYVIMYNCTGFDKAYMIFSASL